MFVRYPAWNAKIYTSDMYCPTSQAPSEKDGELLVKSQMWRVEHSCKLLKLVHNSRHLTWDDTTSAAAMGQLPPDFNEPHEWNDSVSKQQRKSHGFKSWTTQKVRACSQRKEHELFAREETVNCTEWDIQLQSRHTAWNNWHGRENSLPLPLDCSWETSDNNMNQMTVFLRQKYMYYANVVDTCTHWTTKTWELLGPRVALQNVRWMEDAIKWTLSFFGVQNGCNDVTRWISIAATNQQIVVEKKNGGERILSPCSHEDPLSASTACIQS